MVACTGAFGGGSGIGAADATDGELDVVIVPAGSRVAWSGGRGGCGPSTIERQRAVAALRGPCGRGRVAAWGGAQCDGEFVDGGLERVTARAGAFALVVPS